MADREDIRRMGQPIPCLTLRYVTLTVDPERPEFPARDNPAAKRALPAAMAHQVAPPLPATSRKKRRKVSSMVPST